MLVILISVPMAFISLIILMIVTILWYWATIFNTYEENLPISHGEHYVKGSNKNAGLVVENIYKITSFNFNIVINHSLHLLNLNQVFSKHRAFGPIMAVSKCITRCDGRKVTRTVIFSYCFYCLWLYLAPILAICF